MASDPSSFTGLDPQAARAFAEAWLPAWTGGDATRLLAFYTEDAVYSDPGVPGGLQGQAALAAYFGRLLAGTRAGSGHSAAPSRSRAASSTSGTPSSPWETR